MNIGILVPATAETSNMAAIAERLETRGFESLWIPEHPVIPVGFQTPLPGGGRLPTHYHRWADPFLALTVAATVTNSLKARDGNLSAPRTPCPHDGQGHRYPRSVLRRARDPRRRRRLVTRRNRSDGREFPSPVETAPRNHRGHAYLLDAAGTELSRRNGAVSPGLLRSQARAALRPPALSGRPCAQGAGAGRAYL